MHLLRFCTTKVDTIQYDVFNGINLPQATTIDSADGRLFKLDDQSRLPSYHYHLQYIEDEQAVNSFRSALQQYLSSDLKVKLTTKRNGDLLGKIRLTLLTQDGWKTEIKASSFELFEIRWKKTADQMLVNPQFKFDTGPFVPFVLGERRCYIYESQTNR